MPSVAASPPSVAPSSGAWRFGPLAQRARATLGTLVDVFPWTPLGVALAGGAYLALRAFAYAQLDLVWLVTGYAVLGLCALSPLFVVPCALWLRWRKDSTQDDALSLETGQSGPTGFWLPALSWVPLVQARWQWTAPSGAVVSQARARGRASERVQLLERGEHESIVRRVIVDDPFGLARVAFTRTQLRRVRVLPRIGGLRSLPSLSSLAAGSDLPHPLGLEDGDRLELARYTPGDPARYIHWRVFARTRKLMVRKPERAVALAKRCAAFFIAGENDDASAAVARLALQQNLLGPDWVFGTDLAPAGVSRVDAALGQLIASVKARAIAGRGLPAFVAGVEKQGPASLIVFAPPEPGVWVDAVSQLARRRQLRVVVAVDGVAAVQPRAFWRRMLWQSAPARAISADAVQTLVNTLGRAGVPVSVLDRTTGRPLGALARQALAGSPPSAAAAGGEA